MGQQKKDGGHLSGRPRHEPLREIRDDRQRGASQLARRCLELLVEYAETLAGDSAANLSPARLKTELVQLAGEFQSARPSMASIENSMRLFIQSLQRLPESSRDALIFARQEALRLIDQSEQAVIQIARHAAGLVAPGDTVFTHSISSTVVETFRILSTYPVQAIVTESRPGNEGRLLARRLAELQIPVEYITEAQAGLFVGKSAMVLVGADTCLADGAIVNKSGTYLIAMAAHDQGVPFYVCCESFKRSRKRRADIVLEENSGGELELPELPGVTPRNVYFDITPARWITGYISEYGLSEHGISEHG